MLGAHVGRERALARGGESHRETAVGDGAGSREQPGVVLGRAEVGHGHRELHAVPDAELGADVVALCGVRSHRVEVDAVGEHFHGGAVARVDRLAHVVGHREHRVVQRERGAVRGAREGVVRRPAIVLGVHEPGP